MFVLLFLSLRVFRLLSSSLLLFPQRFARYVLRPSSGVCRTSNYVLYWFNKGCSSKLREGSRVWQTPEEGRRTYRSKRCGNTIKMKTIVRKPLMIKINKLRLRNLDNFYYSILISVLFNMKSMLKMFVSISKSYGKWCKLIVRSTIPQVDHFVINVYCISRLLVL